MQASSGARRSYMLLVQHIVGMACAYIFAFLTCGSCGVTIVTIVTLLALLYLCMSLIYNAQFKKPVLLTDFYTLAMPGFWLSGQNAVTLHL